MAYLKPGIFLMVLLACYVKAQFEGETCKVQYVSIWDASVRWCYNNPQDYTIEVRPVGPVVGAYDGPQQVFGCEAVLRNLCSGLTYEVTVRGQTDEMTCKFTTIEGGFENIDPSEVQVAEVTTTSVKFIWKHARCFRLDSSRYYLIKFMLPGNWYQEHQAWGDASLNETHDQYEKTGLTPGRTYSFVFSTCRRHHCPNSEFTKEIKTIGVTPTNPSLKVESITSESFQISWSQPLERNDTVDGYVVYIDDWYPIFPWNTTWKADYLYSDTDYEVSVAAFNTDGDNRLYSENATIVIRTSPRGLDPPQNLSLNYVESTRFRISWNRRSNSFQLEGYRVTVDYSVYWLSPHATSFYKDHLRPNTRYTVQVVAYSGNIMSVPAQTIVWTKETRYNPPRNLTITSVDSSHFEVAWSQPDYLDNERLYGYTVYVNNRLAANRSTWSTTFRKEDLKSSQYSVKVYAHYEYWDVLSDPVSAVIGISKNCTTGGSSSWKQFFAAKFSFLSFSQSPNAGSDEE